jgi:hypothetical protein
MTKLETAREIYLRTMIRELYNSYATPVTADEKDLLAKLK